MKKYILLLVLILSACATPKYNYTPEITLISEPPLDVTTVAYVGDEMLSQGNISSKKGITFSTPQRISGYSFSEGFLPKTGEDDSSVYYTFVNSPSKKPTSEGLATMHKNFIVDPLESVAVSKKDNKVCAVTIFHLKACKANIEFTEDMKHDLNENSFQQTLIYSGRVGDRINISYREFSGNKARPAFNNDVEYDLSVSSEIAYKGALVKVIHADNQKIEYIVRKNFLKTDY